MTRVPPVLLALALAAVCAWAWWDTGLGETDDDARMILEARALWDTGAWPYHTNHLGMVAMLAPVSRSMVGIHLVLWGCFGLAVAATYRLVLACRLTEGWALFGACTYATMPLALFWAAQPMTEIPFTAAMLWALVAGVPAPGVPAPWGWGRPVLAVLLALVACSVRSVGVAVLAPVVLAWVVGRAGWREVGAGVLVAVCAVLPVAWFTGHLIVPDWTMPLRLLHNLARYVTAFAPYAVLPHPETSNATLAAGFFVLAVAAWGLRHRLPWLVTGTVALFVLALLAWPVRLSGERYLIPLLPIAAIGMAGAGARAQEAWDDAWRGWVAAVVVSLACLLVGQQAVWHLNKTLSEGCFRTAGASGYVEAAAWIRDNTPAGAVVVCRKPSAMEVLSRRHAEGYPFTVDRAAVMAWIDRVGATHVVIDGLDYPQTRDYLWPAVDAHRGRFFVESAREFGRPPNTVVVPVKRG